MDILKSADAGEDLTILKASDIMNPNPITIDVNTPIFEAVKILINRHILRLPVIDKVRLVGILSRRDILQGISQETTESEDIVFITDAAKAFFSAKSPRDLLLVLVERIGSYFEAERCSVISVDEKRGIAVVHTTFENPEIKDLEIDLARYPEIMKVFTTGEPVVIRDAPKDPLMQPVLQWLKDIKSIMVFPIATKDAVHGTLYFRTRTKRELSKKDLKMADMLSTMAADALKAIVREKNLLARYKDSEKKVVIDDLTGLYNRRFFEIRLSEEFGMALRHNMPLACIMFDLDDFKKINDTLGHEEGDRVLWKFASSLKKSVRISDIVARYAGDEFMLLLPMADEEGAVKEAARIKSHIDRLDYGPSIGKLTVSIGVAGFPSPGVNKAEDLVKNADDAMYESKKNGRNRICVFKPSYISTK